MSKWKGALVVLACVSVAAALAAAGASVWSSSDALLGARHSRPISNVRAATSPEAIAEGAHLVQIATCASCHDRDLTGGMLGARGSKIYAPNLTIEAKRLTDADLDGAIRRGLRPDASTELVMPAHVYAAFSDAEIGAIISYLRSLPSRGVLSPRPRPGLLLRATLVAGLFQTEATRVAAARPPLDAGPRFAAGRHLAALACGRCHGADLAGGHGAPGPDLTVRRYFDRKQFATLMRTGEGIGEGDTELMSRTAEIYFSHFTDGEINEIFDYLNARDRLLSAGASAGRASGR